MRVTKRYGILVLFLALVLILPWQDAVAMVQPKDTVVQVLPLDTVGAVLPLDSATVPLPRSLGKRNAAFRDSAAVVYADSLQNNVMDSLQRTVGDTLNLNRFNEWKPDPIRAMWLGMVFPGGGQIYNRKFWKLPIVYGGFVGCLYAYNWNGQMYKDYRQAYLDIMDSDPNTDSYKDFFRPGYDYEANKDYLKSVFKKRKDRYRRWRDLSIFSFIGVYALSVVDAYVDAQLAHFDISEDIHLSIEPQIINDNQLNINGYYGLNCSITF